MSSTIFKEGQGDGKPTGKPGLKGGEAAAGASKGRRDTGGSLRGVAEREGTEAGQTQGRGAALRPGQAAGWLEMCLARFHGRMGRKLAGLLIWRRPVAAGGDAGRGRVPCTPKGAEEAGAAGTLPQRDAPPGLWVHLTFRPLRAFKENVPFVGTFSSFSINIHLLYLMLHLYVFIKRFPQMVQLSPHRTCPCPWVEKLALRTG